DLPSIAILSAKDFTLVENYDTDFFPAQRNAFLRAWLCQKDSPVLGIIEDGQLKGYGMIRPCRTGFKIGPLFADTPEHARWILLALSGRVSPGKPLFFDTPATNPAAVELAESQSMNQVFHTARMYTKDFPDLPIDKLFGVTSFELG
ncbi:MAG: GNAT family N-acetyltransferase, partial [Desulfobacteraceae bacterium]|nr:GNAT family N-acetyltransferase [Desulfobacteraceae bacterium]